MKKTVLLRVFFFIIVLVLLFFCKKNMYDHYNNYYKENKYKKIKSDKINPDEPINEIFKNINIIQKLNIEDTKRFSGLGILFATYARETNEGIVDITVFDENRKNKLFEKKIDVKDVKDNQFLDIEIPEINGKKIKNIIVQITSTSPKGKGITIWKSKKNSSIENILEINNKKVDGELVLEKLNKKIFITHQVFYLLIVIISFILSQILYLVFINLKYFLIFFKNKNDFFSGLKKYSYLLWEMVVRDIKVKYKKSTLGLMWSVLNPLLMMIVMTIVFSTLFKSDIENFPIYLLAGQTAFSFFSEATNMAMMSIISNGALLKKVYVPKYIFPTSKVIFSLVNFLFSLIAMVIVIIFTKLQISIHMILFPIFLIYLFIFSLGIGLILASYAVYFRDLVHLYGIFLLVWTYLTPIFYPVKIIPPKFMIIIKLNPMYHFIEYYRRILLYHVWPSFRLNMVCLVFSVLSLIIGAIVFYKKQNEFVLNV